MEEEVFGEQFVEVYPDKGKIKTPQVLDSMTILNVSKHLQETALARLTLKE